MQVKVQIEVVSGRQRMMQSRSPSNNISQQQIAMCNYGRPQAKCSTELNQWGQHRWRAAAPAAGRRWLPTLYSLPSPPLPPSLLGRAVRGDPVPRWPRCQPRGLGVRGSHPRHIAVRPCWCQQGDAKRHHCSGAAGSRQVRRPQLLLFAAPALAACGGQGL